MQAREKQKQIVSNLFQQEKKNYSAPRTLCKQKQPDESFLRYRRVEDYPETKMKNTFSVAVKSDESNNCYCYLLGNDYRSCYPKV